MALSSIPVETGGFWVRRAWALTATRRHKRVRFMPPL